MALTKFQKLAAQAIVQIFETGSVRGDYGKVTVLPGDTGHLTYGKAQTTLASGNLFFLIRDYCEAPGAELAAKLRPFLLRLERKDIRLDRHRTFKRQLSAAGDDPVMHEVQDAFFDRAYWKPAMASAAFIGATTALGVAIIYDSRIHRSRHARRDQVNKHSGALSDLGEKVWMRAYIEHRREWLSTHPNSPLHPTVYRMDELGRLIEAENWDLSLPFTLRGLVISENNLAKATAPSPRASGKADNFRLLRLDKSQFVGEDVREIQKALFAKGTQLTVDGIFGPGTDKAVRAFQKKAGLRPDGIVGGLTREALGLTH
jgi:chitosanase